MASVTINFTAANAARIKPAIANALGLDEGKAPREATEADLKLFIVNSVKDTVRRYERMLAAAQIPAPPAIT